MDDSLLDLAATTGEEELTDLQLRERRQALKRVPRGPEDEGREGLVLFRRDGGLGRRDCEGPQALSPPVPRRGPGARLGGRKEEGLEAGCGGVAEAVAEANPALAGLVVTWQAFSNGLIHFSDRHKIRRFIAGLPPESPPSFSSFHSFCTR